MNKYIFLGLLLVVLGIASVFAFGEISLAIFLVPSGLFIAINNKEIKEMDRE